MDLASISGDLLRGQIQIGLNFFKVTFDFEDESQSPHNTIGILYSSH